MSDRPFVCVFCGSSKGARPAYALAARKLGESIARQGIGLVYGGGHVGLMGVVADAALAAGGHVVGIIPEPLARREIAHPGLTELIVVPGMHERKALMARRSSAFLTLPGGVGTLEELFEVLTWSVLGLHRKPLGMLDVEGYFAPLLAFLDHAMAERFVAASDVGRIVVSDDPETIAAETLASEPPPSRPRWIDEDQT